MQKGNYTWLAVSNSSEISNVCDGIANDIVSGSLTNQHNNANGKDWLELQINLRNLQLPRTTERRAYLTELVSVKPDTLRHLSPFAHKPVPRLVNTPSNNVTSEDHHVFSYHDCTPKQIHLAHLYDSSERQKAVNVDKYRCGDIRKKSSLTKLGLRKPHTAATRDRPEVATLKDVIAEMFTQNDFKQKKVPNTKDHDGSNSFVSRTNDTTKDTWLCTAQKLAEHLKTYPDDANLISYHLIKESSSENNSTASSSSDHADLRSLVLCKKGVSESASEESMKSLQEPSTSTRSKSMSPERDSSILLSFNEMAGASRRNTAANFSLGEDLSCKLQKHSALLGPKKTKDVARSERRSLVETDPESARKLQKITKELKSRYNMCLDDSGTDVEKHEHQRV